MSTDRELTRIVRSWLEEGVTRLPDRVLDEVLDQLPTTRQRPSSWLARRVPHMNLRARIAVAATLIAAVAAVGVTFTLWRGSVDVGVAGPPPILHPGSAEEGWPGAPRGEPFGDPVLVRPVPGSAPEDRLRVVDPQDLDPAHAWIDLTAIDLQRGSTVGEGGVGAAVYLRLGGEALRPIPDPHDLWVAYGLVIDVDHDGVGDIRVGMDNLATSRHREWITDLETGSTAVNAGPTWGHSSAGTFIDTYLPGEADRRDYGRIIVVRPGERLRFYAWAAVVEGGRVLLTDHAPDTGWVEFVPEPVS